MPDDTKAAEERLREAGWTVGDDAYPSEEGYASPPGDDRFWEIPDAIVMLDREEAAEARGRAQGQREGREEIISIIRETVFPLCKCPKYPSCGADSELQTLFERVGLSEKSSDSA